MTSIPSPPNPRPAFSTRKSRRWRILVTLVSPFVLMVVGVVGADLVGNRYGERAFGWVIAFVILSAISGLVFAVTLLIAVVRTHSATEELRLTTPPPLPPDVPEANESRYKPILIALLCAFLLAGGSCYGFATTVGSSDAWVFAVGFGLGVIIFVVGIVWLIADWST